MCGRQRIIERCLALDKQRTRLAARPQSLVATVWVVSSTLLCFSVCPSACWPVGTLTFWPVACLRTQRQKINKMAPSAGHWLSYGAHWHWTPSPTPTATATATRTLAKRHTACKWKCKRASSSPPLPTLILSYLPVASGWLTPPLGCPCTTSAADMIYALMSRFFDKVLNL